MVSQYFAINCPSVVKREGKPDCSCRQILKIFQGEMAEFIELIKCSSCNKLWRIKRKANGSTVAKLLPKSVKIPKYEVQPMVAIG